MSLFFLTFIPSSATQWWQGFMVSGWMSCLFVRLYFHNRTITCKYEWIFTKLCINIVEIRFGIANG